MESETPHQETSKTARHKVVKYLALAFLLSACLSYTEQTRQIKSAYRAKDFKTALAKLEKSKIKNQKNNRLLYLLEKAVIYDRLGQLKKSRQGFLRAVQVSNELYTASISKEVSSFLLSSSGTEYSGEDYEKVYIHALLALSFLKEQNYESALVEARSINLKLHEINSGRGDKNNRYNADAFARYLSGVIYEATDNYDSSYIDYQRALTLYRQEFKIFNNSINPKQLHTAFKQVSNLRNNPNTAHTPPQLIVVHLLGNIAEKRAKDFLIPVGKQLLRYSYPVIKPSKQTFPRTGVRLQNNTFRAAEQLVNLDQIAHVSLRDKRLLLTTKQITRLTTKGVLTQQAHKHLGLVGGIAANILSASTETADTRSWSLLPSLIKATRLSLKANKTTVVSVVTAGVITEILKLKLKHGEVKIIVSQN